MKKIFCLLLSLIMLFSLPVFAQAETLPGGPIDSDDNAELINPYLEKTSAPTGAVAVAKSLNTGEVYYYRVSGAVITAVENGLNSKPGWMPDNASLDAVIPEDGDSRTLVTNTQTSPHSAIALISVVHQAPSGQTFPSVSTAVMIGPDVALTTAHSLYHDTYGWPIAVMIMPALNTLLAGASAAPYGYAYASEVAIGLPYYENRQDTHDWGVVKFRTSIGNTSGYLGFRYETRYIPHIEGHSVSLCGYPGDKNNNFQDANGNLVACQYIASGPIHGDVTHTTTKYDGTIVSYRQFQFYIDAHEGQSGSPILYESQVIGVYQGGPSTTVNTGVGITDQLFSFLWSYT